MVLISYNATASFALGIARASLCRKHIANGAGEGIRQDAYANTHRIPIEQEKPDSEKGTFLHARRRLLGTLFYLGRRRFAR